MLHIKKKNFTPVQICSLILSYIKIQIVTYTNKNIVDNKFKTSSKNKQILCII
jgi:hypothetical protein